jgi:hypothetical protein
MKAWILATSAIPAIFVVNGGQEQEVEEGQGQGAEGGWQCLLHKLLTFVDGLDEIEHGISQLPAAVAQEPDIDLKALEGYYVAGPSLAGSQASMRAFIIRAIQAAKKSIDVMMYCFDDDRIAEAIVAAAKKNKTLTVRIVVDAG